MDIRDPFVLPEDVLIIPAGELSEKVLRSIDADDCQFAVSRPGARAASTMIDARAAALLERFRVPTTLTQAAILFGRENGMAPEAVLEESYPMLRKFVNDRILVAEGESQASDLGPWLAKGAVVAGHQVVHPIMILEDTELYLVRASTGEAAVLKLAREPASGAARLLANEADVLDTLGGGASPKLLGRGEIDSRPYLLMEYVAGVDALQAAEELREEGRRGRPELLALMIRIVRAYAGLHDRGLLHGDVHPSNILVDGSGEVRLIDFGFADCADPESTQLVPRGGVPFYMEPEQARHLRQGRSPGRSTPAGEQYAVGALLYELVSGVHYVEFKLGREQMLAQIVEASPLPFESRSVEMWPAVEAALFRSLSKDPTDRFASMRSLVRALEQARESETTTGSESPPGGTTFSRQLHDARQEILTSLGIDGPIFEQGVREPPTASLNHGAAGIAYLLYRVSMLTGDPRRIADAQVWATRAEADIDSEAAFYDVESELTLETIGSASPCHTKSGVYAVQALIASVLGATEAQRIATDRFLRASRDGANGLDAAVGVCSVLLGSTLLLEVARRDSHLDTASLEDRGHQLLRALWGELDEKAPIADADIDYLGAAHGWAGFLYTTLLWCRAVGTPPPATLEPRLHELVQLAEPVGRGIMWPWLLNEEGGYMAGWCNGSAGYVFLWTLAAETYEDARWTDIAVKAGWNAVEASDPTPTLCCGLIGRAYALLNLYKHTGERRWLEWAKRVTYRAIGQDHYSPEYSLSLYKGSLPLALLDVELERPMESAYPFFESEIWAIDR